jgi:hypothetical protein
MEEAFRQPPGTGEPPGGGEITVTTVTQLKNALDPKNAGRRILVNKGTYEVNVPLRVPDGASLVGKGEMTYVGGLPDTFTMDNKTTITGLPDLKGDLLTLGNRSSVRRLILEILEVNTPGVPENTPKFGNVVAVASGGPGDSVSAAIDECQLINKNPAGAGAEGPVGGALLACTRNPEGDPPPHEDAVVTVRVSRSLVEPTGGGPAVFAMNFATGGKVTVELIGNRIRGSLDAVGGLSRPNAVFDATTTIRSRGNLYSGSDGPAWQIIGGSHGPGEESSGASANSASAHSRNDRIKGFQLGIFALGGRRFSSDGGTSSFNVVELDLIQLRLETEGTEAADFLFAGSLSFGPFLAGDENTVRVRVRKTIGSGPRENLYTHSGGFGTGNQLTFDGTLAAFIRSNEKIDPAPPAEFFALS